MEEYYALNFLGKWVNKYVVSLLLTILLSTSILMAEENNLNHKSDTLAYSWERFSFNLGGFIAGLNNDIQIGSQQVGLGVIINVEDALGLETTTLALRSEIEYNYGKRRRNNLRFGYFTLYRDARKILESEITIGKETFPVGTEVTSKFSLQIMKGTYEYSFFIDERVKLGASIGLYIMPISFSTNALGLSEEVAEFVAPLPVLGLGANFAITPKIRIKQSVEILYLEFSTFKGSLMDLNIKFEYNPWNHLGFALGLNSYQLNIKATKANSTFLDFEGSIKSSFTGLLFYGRYYF